MNRLLVILPLLESLAPSKCGDIQKGKASIVASVLSLESYASSYFSLSSRDGYSSGAKRKAPFSFPTGMKGSFVCFTRGDY